MKINYLVRPISISQKRPNRGPKSENWRAPACFCRTVFGHIVDPIRACAQPTHKALHRHLRSQLQAGRREVRLLAREPPEEAATVLQAWSQGQLCACQFVGPTGTCRPIRSFEGQAEWLPSCHSVRGGQVPSGAPASCDTAGATTRAHSPSLTKSWKHPRLRDRIQIRPPLLSKKTVAMERRTNLDF